MTGNEDRMGRAMLLRLEAGRPLTALSPAWAGLSGLLASGHLSWSMHTVISAILMLLLVEPLMGGLWETARAVAKSTNSDCPSTSSSPAGIFLPYLRPGSLADRLIAWFAGGEQQRWQGQSLAVSLLFALAVGSVLGPVLLLVVIALAVLAARLRWQKGIVSFALGAVYDLLLPWLIGMVTLVSLGDLWSEAYRPALFLAVSYTLAYAACLTLAKGSRLRGLLVLDIVQVAIFALLLVRQEVLAAWLLGLSLIGQVWAHPEFVNGGSGHTYVRRVAPYIIVGMLAAVIALAPGWPGM